MSLPLAVLLVAVACFFVPLLVIVPMSIFRLHNYFKYIGLEDLKICCLSSLVFSVLFLIDYFVKH